MSTIRRTVFMAFSNVRFRSIDPGSDFGIIRCYVLSLPFSLFGLHPMYKNMISIVAGICFSFGLVAGVQADNWPQFRGPGGKGTAADTTIPTVFDDKENVLWKIKLPGLGNS